LLPTPRSAEEKLVIANNHGTTPPNGRTGGRIPPATTPSVPAAPRRLVLLTDGEHSEVSQVLAEYSGKEMSGERIHQDLQRFAADHAGKNVAVEWLGKLGWTRFLWCRK
jgi:hypothetical protein